MSHLTLTKLIQEAKGEAINARDTKCTLAHQCYEMYWKVALLMHERKKCDTIWVCGYKRNNTRDWVAGVSVTILRYLNTTIKLHGGNDDACGFVIIEPLGTIAHRLKPSAVLPLINRVDIPVSFHDPNQQSFLDETPKGTPCLKP